MLYAMFASLCFSTMSHCVGERVIREPSEGLSEGYRRPTGEGERRRIRGRTLAMRGRWLSRSVGVFMGSLGDATAPRYRRGGVWKPSE